MKVRPPSTADESERAVTERKHSVPQTRKCRSHTLADPEFKAVRERSAKPNRWCLLKPLEEASLTHSRQGSYAHGPEEQVSEGEGQAEAGYRDGSGRCDGETLQGFQCGMAPI